MPKGWVLAHVSQLIPNSEQSAIEFVLNGDKPYRALHTQLDHLHTLIENHPFLLDEEFDQDLFDLEREFEELRQLLNH